MKTTHHAELIAFHESRLQLHEDDLPLTARAAHETALAELRKDEPYREAVADLLRQRKATASGPERAVIETELQQLAYDKLTRLKREGKRPGDPEVAAAYRLWKSVTTPDEVRDLPPTEAALEWMHRERATLSLSERQPQQQDEPTAEDRILAEIAGKPLPDDRVPEVDPERVRRLHEAQARAERHDELTKLAEGIDRASAEEALGYVELEEADPTGALRFELSDAERAAAALLRDDREESALIRELSTEVRESRARLDEIARSGDRLDLSERSVYELTDAHGAELLCIDFPMKTVKPN